ncbi:hypothetical protein D3C79_762160 [compost metagenome]
MAATVQGFTGIEARYLELTVENIAAGRQDQRVRPHLFPHHTFIHHVGNARCRRFLMVLNGQVIPFFLHQLINKIAHRHQPVRIGHVVHHGIPQRIKLLLHLCR